MTIKMLLIKLLLSTFLIVDSSAQVMPLVYDVENTCADCPEPYLPTFSELPVIPNLPDPFEWSDGRGRVANFNDWRYRRAEIKTEIENYEIGIKPDRPDTITASYSGGVLTVNVTENGRTLTLTSAIALPAGEGPFPAVIGMNSPSGPIDAAILSSRNIARITYNHNQVTTYGSAQNSNPYYQLYPHLNVDNTGQYSAWSWGVSRLIDGLELVQDSLPIDLEHIAVAGCSYAGKMALFAGAFDERIALTFSIESGGGGYTTWRYSEVINQTESVETLGKTDYSWFKNDMSQFSGTGVSKLPEDHHELMAMVAPRALFVTGNPGWVWLADESGHVGSNAAKKVWEALGVPDRFGYSLIGGHFHCAIPEPQVPQIEAFIDKFLLGIDTVNTNVATSPYTTNLTSWITWDTPVLGSGTSYFGRASLYYPPDHEADLDTAVTFLWNTVQDAQTYYFQLATDAAFQNLIESDSTNGDTTKTVTGLSDGIRYYWRIRVRNSEGDVGPFSEVWNFSTYIPLPASPELADPVPLPDRTDYFTFSWSRAEYADQYVIQLSHTDAFSPIFKSGITEDTVITLSGFTEGRKEYWRLRAENISGFSPWIDSSFVIKLKTPENLALQLSAPTEVTLTWADRSLREDGYLIERRQNPDTSFTVIDTTAANTNQFIDNTLEQGMTYSYRVKAYNSVSVSDFSNEVSTTTTEVKHGAEIPDEYSLNQNFPNPFNPSTQIKFGLPEASLTKLIIYDLLGREVNVLINKNLEAGYHEIIFNANSFPSGIYLYRIEAGDFVQTRKMILIK